MKTIVSLAAALAVSACATTTPSTDLPARSAAFAATDAGEQSLPTYRVMDINVTVPRTLKVSEANRYYPVSDIVWRGDPLGDRYEQITAIFQDAMQRGTKDMNGLVPVSLDIEVMRFHSLTEKTRYTVGGVHSITFALSLRNADTGLALGERRIVKADLPGFGGQRAIDAERKGQTQKVRITAHLANVIRTELEMPTGYENENLGAVQVLNRF
jgi:hypothetical protein